MSLPADVEGTVRAFFGALGRGDWKGASGLATDPLDVFGTAASRASVATGLDRSLGPAVLALRTVPLDFFTPQEHPTLFGGPVPGHGLVCFATVEVAGEPATYGLVVVPEEPGPRVARLFDPTPFKHFAESLDAARRGVEQVDWG